MPDAALKEKFSNILPFLNEKQTRLYLSSEALALGRGGVTLIHKITGVSRSRIHEGINEIRLGTGTTDKSRIRAVGGGRKPLTDKYPNLLEELSNLIEPTTRGDPMSPLRWTIKSTNTLSTELKEKGMDVSPMTVHKLLREQGYSLQSNFKTKEGGTHPDRDEQFNYINDLSKKCILSNEPVLSIDCKKKEILGDHKQQGKQWKPKGKPTEVKVYDFIDKELGKASPYGIYDIEKNEGYVNVGISKDTAEFAVNSLRKWWYTLGAKQYSKTKSILITADSGGSNSARSRLWKKELQKLSNELNLNITVLHYPPGTSKWNKIEHRLFSMISINWKGEPLKSIEIILNLIKGTKTDTGLKVEASHDKNKYETGIKVSDEEMANINIKRHDKHPNWNYTISPNV